MWEEERNFRTTASRCYNLYTCRSTDWEKKACKYFWPTPFSSIYTEYGRKCEAKVREVYSNNLKVRVVKRGLIICKNDSFLGYSPDGIMVDEHGIAS